MIFLRRSDFWERKETGNMDIGRLDWAGVDYKDGVSRFLGKSELYEKFVQKFPEDPTFPTLRDAMNTGDLKKAFLCAHSLKGIAENLSFTRLTEATKPLVEALRGNGNQPLANQLFPAVEAEYRKLLEAIEG